MPKPNLPSEVTAAISGLCYSQPFFAEVLFNGTKGVTYQPDCPTAATDGDSIWVGDWFRKQPIKERVGVLCHEVLHVIFDHCGRGKLYADRGFGPDFTPFNTKVWNMATDAVINRLLLDDCKLTLPTCAYLHDTINGSWVVDDAYTELMKTLTDDEKEDSANHGEAGPGSEPVGSMDTHIQPKAPSTKAQQQEKDRVLKAAVDSAKMQGKLPGGLRSFVEEALEVKVRWQDVVMLAATANAGEERLDYTRPLAKRLVWGEISGQVQPILPSVKYLGAGVMVVQIDVSGSISDAEVTTFLSEIKGIASLVNPTEMYLLWTDSTVVTMDHCQSGTVLDDIEDVIRRVTKDGAPGGGGTDMREGFEYCAEWGIYPDTMVTLTDGYTPWPKSSNINHVACITNDHKALAADIGFGQVVHCEVG